MTLNWGDLGLLKGRGDGTFLAPVSVPKPKAGNAAKAVSGVAVGDLNKDGKDDLVLAGYVAKSTRGIITEATTYVTVYKARNAGSFKAEFPAAGPLGQWRVPLRRQPVHAVGPRRRLRRRRRPRRVPRLQRRGCHRRCRICCSAVATALAWGWRAGPPRSAAARSPSATSTATATPMWREAQLLLQASSASS
ncbi:MAG: VCBS repeat-containing protein [Gemmataceae bacterium]